MIQTSYFRKPGLPLECTCAISLGVPRGWKGRRYPSLAPSRELLNVYKSGHLTWDDYTEEYQYSVLDNLSTKLVAADLDGWIMVCWERSDNPHCHRRLVADWLAAATGEQVREWEPLPPAAGR